jgi:hypothetical protein
MLGKTLESAGRIGGTYCGGCGKKPYDQEDQANCIVSAVDLFQRASVDGTFLFCLFWPMQNDAESYGILDYVGTPHNRAEDASVRLRRNRSYYAYQSYRL